MGWARMMYSKKLVFVGLFAVSAPVMADEAGRSAVLSHPFQVKANSFNLGARVMTRDSLRPLEEQGPDEVQNAGLSSRFRLRQKNVQGLNLFQNRHIESVSYGFDLDEVPLCDIEVKVHRSMDGYTSVMGEIPNIDANAPSLSEKNWSAEAQVAKIVGETLLMASLGTSYNVESKDRCIWSDGLKPVWKMTLAVNGLNYEMIVDGNEVYRFDPKHFHTTGTATIYPTNKNDGAAAPVELREMDATGFLANPYFQVCLPTSASKVICKPTDGTALYAFAQEANWVYNYNPADAAGSNKFTQASIFAHTNTALEWLQSHGYKNFGTAQIKLLAHAKIGGDVNNALYQPASGGASPMILVGDGDNNVLQNLGTDADVVSHELGHHVVYNTVTDIRGESLVIHEALADFFTFARTGNACLGESICPDTPIGLQVCAVPKQCLRSAENTYAYGDADLPDQAHLRGQFVSGLLWDLHAKDNIVQDDVTNLVLKSIDLLVSNSGYKHLIVGMLLVDHAEYRDKYCSTILARAKVRGLGTILSDVTCDSIVSSTNSQTNVSTFLNTGTTATRATSSSVSKKAGKSCGVLNAGGGSGQSASLLLILSLPFAITWIRRKKT